MYPKTISLQDAINLLFRVFLFVMFLIPQIIMAQNKTFPQPQDTTGSALDTTIDSSFSLAKDPNFPSQDIYGHGQNNIFYWIVNGDSQLDVQFNLNGHSNVKGSGNLYYRGYDAKGDSYFTMDGKNYVYNARKDADNITQVPSIPAHLKLQGNPPSVYRRPQNNSAQQQSAQPSSNQTDDDDPTSVEAAITKQGNIFILTMKDGSKHTVSRPDFFKNAELWEGMYYEDKKGTDKVILYSIKDGEENGEGKGKISVTATNMTKAQFNQLYISKPLQ